MNTSTWQIRIHALRPKVTCVDKESNKKYGMILRVNTVRIITSSIGCVVFKLPNFGQQK